jgi:hypothetical protein
MACVPHETMLDLSDGQRVGSTNRCVSKEIARYPQRVLGIHNVEPVFSRGVTKAIRKLEYAVKDRNPKVVSPIR